MVNGIIIIGSVSAAILSVGGIAVAIIKWVLNQNKQSEDIEALKKKHDMDMAETQKKRERRYSGNKR